MDEDDPVADLLQVARNGKKTGWPKMPGHDAGLKEIRDYLTQAARLPRNWTVDLAERHGQYAGDPLTITIRTPGDAPNVNVRFDNQRDCSKAGALRGAFSEGTRGQSRMKYPKPAEASDFYVMVCALADVAVNSTIAEETRAWLDEYLERGSVIEKMTLGPEFRLDAMLALRKRPEFDRIQASKYLRGELDEMDRWAIVPDSVSGELWIRAGEFITYLRHVYGERIAQSTLDSRVMETGGEKVRLEVDKRYMGGQHVILVFYRFPSHQAFPSVIRIDDPS